MNEQRASPRHALEPPLACFLYSPEGRPAGAAVAQNVSAGGLELYAARPIQPGDHLGAELVNAPATLRRRLPWRVVHVRLDPDGGYLVGGQFLEPLSASELNALAGHS